MGRVGPKCLQGSVVAEDSDLRPRDPLPHIKILVEGEVENTCILATTVGRQGLVEVVDPRHRLLRGVRPHRDEYRVVQNLGRLGKDVVVQLQDRRKDVCLHKGIPVVRKKSALAVFWRCRQVYGTKFLWRELRGKGVDDHMATHLGFLLTVLPLVVHDRHKSEPLFPQRQRGFSLEVCCCRSLWRVARGHGPPYPPEPLHWQLVAFGQVDFLGRAVNNDDIGTSWAKTPEGDPVRGVRQKYSWDRFEPIFDERPDQSWL